MKLVFQEGKPEVKLGQTVKDFRGEECKVVGMTEPQHAGSSGRVTLQYMRKGAYQRASEYFPSVIGAKWVPE